MRRSSQPWHRKILPALIAAVTLHFGLLALGHATAEWLGWGKGSGSFRYRPFEITLQRTSQEEQEDEEARQRQVVSIPPPEREERPDKAQFSSEFDSRVQKESKARHRRLAAMLNNRSAREVSPQGPVGPGSKGGRTDVPKTLSHVERTLTQDRSLLSMRETRDTGEDVQQRDKGGELKSGPKTSKRLTMADLRPSGKALSKAIGAAFPDALTNVPEGEKTLLNTKRWRFASFFNRVKAAVAQHWNPGAVYRRYDPTGNVYGFKSRLTVLKVWLYPDGRLKKIVLRHPCGLGFLDDEAIRAFRAAAPFPNPPKRLVDKKTNTITFSFGFIFEIVRGPVFRIFRYR